MNKKRKNTQKIYYSIGEVAKMFNVNTSLIRYWEKEFDIIKPYKNKKGNRYFSNKDIDYFHMIYNLVKEKGYTLQGAKDIISKRSNKTEEKFEVIKTLENVKKFLLEIKNNIPGN